MSPLLRRLAALAALASVVVLQACAASASPDYDARFGSAWRTLQGQQVADPGATQRHSNATPASDAKAVLAARERYLESFAAPPATNVTSINVGGGLSK